jgi:hypothetical protein
MPSLLDSPLPDAVRLLCAVADGFGTARGEWPVWQYVVRQLDDEAPDAEKLLQGLPTWQHHYRPIFWNSSTVVPAPGDAIQLTVHGMVHARHPATEPLVAGFLAALRLAGEKQREIEPVPTKAVEVELQGSAFTDEVNKRAGSSLSSGQLLAVLNHEPATWTGVQGTAENWTWDLTWARLRPYRDVHTAEEYLARLEELVGVAGFAASPIGLPAMALPDAFDHLDLAWRLVVKAPLLRIPRAAMAAKLALPAISVEEFESRCSALADLLNNLQVSGDGPALQAMKGQLSELLRAEDARAHTAVDVLRNVVALRAGQQHHGADIRAERARAALGLTRFGSDWAGSWDQLRSVTVEALATIREELTRLIER